LREPFRHAEYAAESGLPAAGRRELRTAGRSGLHLVLCTWTVYGWLYTRLWRNSTRSSRNVPELPHPEHLVGGRGRVLHEGQARDEVRGAVQPLERSRPAIQGDFRYDNVYRYLQHADCDSLPIRISVGYPKLDQRCDAWEHRRTFSWLNPARASIQGELPGAQLVVQHAGLLLPG